MALVFRWLVRITAPLIAAEPYWRGAGLLARSRSLPDYDDTVAVRGLSAPVEIVRDNANVPHIFGQTDAMCSSVWASPMRRTGCGR